MMILCVFCIVLVLFFLAFLIPVRFQVLIGNHERYIYLKVLFLKKKIDLNQTREEAKKEEPIFEEKKVVDEKEKKQKQRSFNKQPIKEIYQLLKPVPKAVQYLKRGIKIYHVRVSFQISTEDAAKTAILYGKICTLFFSLFRFLQTFLSMKVKRVEIIPDFHHTQMQYHVFFILQIRIYRVLFAGILYLLNILKNVIQNNLLKAKIKTVK